jgi:hypothetical protein
MTNTTIVEHYVALNMKQGLRRIRGWGDPVEPPEPAQKRRRRLEERRQAAARRRASHQVTQTVAARTPVAPLPRKPKFATPQQRPTPHPTPLLIGSLLPWDRTVSSWPWVPGDHPVATAPGPHFCGSAPLAGAPPRGPSRHGLPVRTAFFRFFPFPNIFDRFSAHAIRSRLFLGFPQHDHAMRRSPIETFSGFDRPCNAPVADRDFLRIRPAAAACCCLAMCLAGAGCAAARCGSPCWRCRCSTPRGGVSATRTRCAAAA